MFCPCHTPVWRGFFLFVLTRLTFGMNDVYWEHQTRNSDSTMRKEKGPEKHGDYRKLCIINHVQHEVYIEVVAVSLLEDKYNGDEEAYIMDMYGYPKEYLENGYVSWEWFVGIYDYTDEDLGLDMPNIEKINELWKFV